MRFIITLILIVFFIGIISSITLIFLEKPTGHYIPYSQPLGAEGDLPIAAEEFEPVIEEADNKVKEQFSKAQTYGEVSQYLSWIIVLLSIVCVLLAASNGKLIAIVDIANTKAKDISASESGGGFRVVCMLLALLSASNFLVQKLDSESTKYLNSAKLLNSAIHETHAVIYDENTSELVARISVRELKSKILMSW